MMPKTVWVLLALLTSTSLAGQAEFSWGVELYPNFSSRRLVAQTTEFDQEEADRLENLEVARFSYSAGLAGYWRTDRIGFKTGLFFTESGYETRRQEIDPREESPDGAESKRVQYAHQYIEIPGELLFYQNLNAKNDFLFSMGISAAVNLSNRERTTFLIGDTNDRQTTTAPGNFTSLGFSFISGLGWEHQFSRFALSLQPTFQFWLRGLLNDESAIFNRNLYSVGLRTGVKF